MPRRVPWDTLEEAVSVLSKRRDVLARQIEALRIHTLDREVLLVLQYVVLASAKGVAEWANAQGWTMPGAKGKPRQYSADDVLLLIKTPSLAVGSDLHALVLEILNKNRIEVTRAFG